MKISTVLLQDFFFLLDFSFLVPTMRRKAFFPLRIYFNGLDCLQEG